ncbi:urocanate hydratase [Desulfovirgula thermocuniculi]|uniref:urocanate hydratase n=1 Tax=Desulfovirgula thermocuniculi TaxID=348842 RepID=UPI00047F822D|nr:urocanate hydratase [Desulfovirgula thermocuniculi]
MQKIWRAPRGRELTCRGWQQEGILRLLLNCLDPEVALKPQELIVYGGGGKAARNHACLEAIIEALRELGNDETLLVQSGKPVAVFRTFPWSPRVLMACALIVPAWANWDHFRQLEAAGLTMFGQSTAAAWAFIGTQGILQGTFETFAAIARQHFGGSLAGRVVLTSGLGNLGGAQPLAVTMNGGVALVVEVDRKAIERQLLNSYCDLMVTDTDTALELVQEAMEMKQPRSIALLGNAADIYPELVSRGWQPDIVTDQTPAHDLLGGYIPAGLSPAEAEKLRAEDPGTYLELSQRSIVRHLKAMLAFRERGAVVFEYGNNIRQQAFRLGVERAFEIPGFVPAAIRPFFCEGRGPFRWVALSGEPEDIYRIDEVVLREFADQPRLVQWIRAVQDRVPFQGLPARVCWLNYRERCHLGLLINEMVRRGELVAPVAITRDHLDAGAAASPVRETEGMLDGSDAVADWPVLNALLNSISGATLAGVFHGAGVGIGYSIHSGMTVIADGSSEAAWRLERVLTNDPGLGIIRYADAGYELARKVAGANFRRPLD